MKSQLSPRDSKYAEDQFSVYGWTYFISDERDDEDFVKLNHFIVSGVSGETISVPFSPYAVMTRQDVINFILLGFPKHGPNGAFSSQQLAEARAAVEPAPEVMSLGEPRFLNLRDGGNLVAEGAFADRAYRIIDAASIALLIAIGAAVAWRVLA